MLIYINLILKCFQSCFTGKAAFLWFEIVLCHAPLYKVDGLANLIGDGLKQAKEGRFMPNVKNCFRKQKTLRNQSKSTGRKSYRKKGAPAAGGSSRGKSKKKILRMRSLAKETVSEAAIVYYLKKHILTLSQRAPNFIVQEKCILLSLTRDRATFM